MTGETLPFLHIVCYKWGPKYPSEEVNLLRSMVARNLNVDHRFHCITDDPSGLDGDIVAHDLHEGSAQTNLRKLRTFSRDFLGLEGEFVVSLDIDIVIVDNIDFLADDPEEEFLIARDFRNPERVHGAVYRLRVGSRPQIWENYAGDPLAADRQATDRTDPEQQWIEQHAGEYGHFPEGKIVSFKHDCGARSARIFGPYGARLGLTTSHFGSARIPPGAAIISFHGNPLPRDLRQGRFMEWRKAPFIAEHWRR